MDSSVTLPPGHLARRRVEIDDPDLWLAEAAAVQAWVRTAERGGSRRAYVFAVPDGFDIAVECTPGDAPDGIRIEESQGGTFTMGLLSEGAEPAAVAKELAPQGGCLIHALGSGPWRTLSP